MSILGNLKVKKRIVEVIVAQTEEGEPITFTLRCPRLGEVEVLSESLPEPTPPVKRDGNGRPITMRDDRGRVVKDGRGSPMVERDEEDPEFVKANDRRDRALTVAIFFACMDGQIKPATPEKLLKEDPISYYLDVWAELEEAGLDVGSFKALSAAIVSLGQPLTHSELVKAQALYGLDRATQVGLKEDMAANGQKAPSGK